jgi:hypothetical protein
MQTFIRTGSSIFLETDHKEHRMRKSFIILSAAAAVAFAAPAMAQSRYDAGYGPAYNPAPWIGGAAVGTTVGLGLYHGWFGSGALASSLPTTAAGAAVAGGVAGVGTVALIDAATQPCAGFRALLSPFAYAPGQSGCVNGQYVGYRVSERAGPRRRY